MRRADVTLTLLPREYQNPSSTQNVEERVTRETKRERESAKGNNGKSSSTLQSTALSGQAVV